MATVMPLMKAKGETIINDIAVDIGEAEKQQSKVKVVVVWEDCCDSPTKTLFLSLVYKSFLDWPCQKKEISFYTKWQIVSVSN